MRNIIDIILHDFKRLTSSVVALVILMGLIVVPCLFAWFNILSNDDPFEPASTGRIPVAVAVEDEGTEMLGMKINVGDKFLDAVNGNDMIGWDTSCDKDKAIEGVYKGDYYAAVIVPNDFSEKILSFSTGELQRPRILFYENEKSNAIAPKITDRVSEVLEEEIDKAFVDTIGQYVTEAANAAEASGLDPQDAFGDISDAMNDLDTDLGNSLAVVNAVAGLSDAADDLLQASNDLISNSEETLDLSQDLLGSSESRITEKANTASLEKAVGDITTLLSNNLATVKRDLSSVRNNMDLYNSFLAGNLAKRQKLLSDTKTSTDRTAKKLNDLGLTGLASRFSRVSDKLNNTLKLMDGLTEANTTNWSTIQGVIDDILADIDFAQKSAVSIEGDIDDKLNGKVDKAISDARQTISRTRESLSGINGNMHLLENALEKSDNSLKSLQGGLAGTIATLTSLQNGSRNLAELFDSLANSDLLDDVNHLMTNDAAVIAANMATPIKMKTEEIYPIRNFGSVMTPFYTVIAQWIGALFAAVMIRVQVRRREGMGQIRLHEAFFGRYRLFLMIGLAQALLVSLGELLYVGIQCLHPLLFILAACVNSLVFTLIIYSLVFAFENIGLAISVIAMIVQIAGGGGTFPVEVLPPVFRAMFPFMPFRYSMDAMRECIGGTYGATYVKCLLILLLFGLVSVLLGLLLHKPMRGLIEMVEESKKESDVML